MFDRRVSFGVRNHMTSMWRTAFWPSNRPEPRRKVRGRAELLRVPQPGGCIPSVRCQWGPCSVRQVLWEMLKLGGFWGSKLEGYWKNIKRFPDKNLGSWKNRNEIIGTTIEVSWEWSPGPLVLWSPYSSWSLTLLILWSPEPTLYKPESDVEYATNQASIKHKPTVLHKHPDIPQTARRGVVILKKMFQTGSLFKLEVSGDLQCVNMFLFDFVLIN